MRMDAVSSRVLLGGAAAAGALVLGACARRQPPTVGPSAEPSPAPDATARPAPGAQRRIAQLNAHNLFDTVDQPRVQDDVLTPAQYDRKLAKLSLAIRDAMGAPDVIALQEIENERVLRDLAARPELRHLGYEPIIVEGSDPRGIDVAYLYRRDRIELVHHEQEQTTFVSPAGRRIRLFTRPPLVATFRAAGDDAAAGAAFTMINNHFTSQLQGEAGARKRRLQAAFVSSIADGRTGVAHLDPRRVVVIGDLNEGVDAPGYRELVEGSSAARPAFVNAADHVPEADRYSFRRGSRRTLLDHVLLTPSLDAAVLGVRIPHISSDPSPRHEQDATSFLRASDHDPVVVDLRS